MTDLDLLAGIERALEPVKMSELRGFQGWEVVMLGIHLGLILCITRPALAARSRRLWEFWKDVRPAIESGALPKPLWWEAAKVYAASRPEPAIVE